MSGCSQRNAAREDNYVIPVILQVCVVVSTSSQTFLEEAHKLHSKKSKIPFGEIIFPSDQPSSFVV